MLLLDTLMSALYTFGALYIVTSGKQHPDNLCCEESAIHFRYDGVDDHWTIGPYFRSLPDNLQNWLNDHQDKSFTRTNMEELIEKALEASGRSIYLSVKTVDKKKIMKRSLYEIQTNGDFEKIRQDDLLCPVTFGMPAGSNLVFSIDED